MPFPAAVRHSAGLFSAAVMAAPPRGDGAARGVSGCQPYDIHASASPAWSGWRPAPALGRTAEDAAGGERSRPKRRCRLLARGWN